MSNDSKKVLFAQVTESIEKKQLDMLGSRGFKVYTAHTAEDALEIHRAENVDLIVAELDLPDMGGDGLCAKIKDDVKLKRVYVSLVCSGKNTEIERCGKCGADTYIPAPPRLEAIVDKICRILDSDAKRDKRVLLKCSVKGTYMEEPFFSTSKDLSVSGIMFETDRTLARGDRIELSFYLPDANQIEAAGRVVRVLGGDNNIYRCGVEFI
jgi:DNA-binding response OmpR family regulator